MPIINTDDYEIVWMDGKTEATPLYVNERKSHGFIVPPNLQGFQILRRGYEHLCEVCQKPGKYKVAISAQGIFTLNEAYHWVVRCVDHLQ